MSPDTKRTAVLLAVLAAVAVLVILDKSSGSGDDDTASVGNAEVYRAEAGLLAETRAVADSQPSWEADAEALRRAWDDRRARMIAAPSAEIAAARLRAMIEQLLLDEGLALATSETLPSVAAGESGEVMLVGLSLSFDASDAAPVYRVLDRVEHMAGAASRIESVALRGPGRMGGAGRLGATIRVRAVAHLTGGPSRG